MRPQNTLTVQKEDNNIELMSDHSQNRIARDIKDYTVL